MRMSSDVAAKFLKSGYKIRKAHWERGSYITMHKYKNQTVLVDSTGTASPMHQSLFDPNYKDEMWELAEGGQDKESFRVCSTLEDSIGVGEQAF